MTWRGVETGLAWFSLAGLVVYFPLETWVSLPHGLLSPFYIVDFIAMLLLVGGGLRSLRGRPRRAPGLLCAAWAWAACNGWRATFWRVSAVAEGRALEHGMTELWLVGTASTVALAVFVLSLALVLSGDS